MEVLFHLLLLLLLLGLLLPIAESTTIPSDVEALRAFKAGVDPSSITPGTCLSTWNFTIDPCDSLTICGLRCSFDDPRNRRVLEIILDTVGYNGTLSPALGKLTALQTIDVSENSFTGPIPGSLGQLTSLIKLDLSTNRLSGAIPDSISKLANLTYLSFAQNQLQGRIPSSLFTLPYLEYLYLQGNKLSGQIPSMSGLTRLYGFDASDNMLTELPSELPESLGLVALRNNQLGGNLTLRKLDRLSFLMVLDLSSNRFTGEVSPGLFTLPNLQELHLSNNSFTSLGLPDVSRVDSQLVLLDMSYNRLEGPLPVFLANLTRLRALTLRYNSFSGTIPYEFASKAVSATEPLMRLFLDGNYLIGDVPQPFAKVQPLFDASFVYNCLRNCPKNMTFCQGGEQRPKSECPTL